MTKPIVLFALNIASERLRGAETDTHFLAAANQGIIMNAAILARLLCPAPLGKVTLRQDAKARLLAQKKPGPRWTKPCVVGLN